MLYFIYILWGFWIRRGKDTGETTHNKHYRGAQQYDKIVNRPVSQSCAVANIEKI